MLRRMNGIVVSTTSTTDNGQISIEQNITYGETSQIFIDAHQVPKPLEWLEEAAAKINGPTYPGPEDADA